jgi:hypothetical protein
MHISKLTREDVVEAWVYSGVMDFYIAFFMSNKNFQEYGVFYYHQGLEKVCKAYLLGAKPAEYESLPEQTARNRVDEIAREMGHNLREMIEKLIAARILDGEVLKKKMCYLENKALDGSGMLNLLEKAYLESRYPVPNPAYKGFPLQGIQGYWDPITSCSLDDFADDIGLKVIQRIEQDFGISITRDKLRNAIDEKDWKTFRRIFFKDNSV